VDVQSVWLWLTTAWQDGDFDEATLQARRLLQRINDGGHRTLWWKCHREWAINGIMQ